MKKCILFLAALYMSFCSFAQTDVDNDFDLIRQHVAFSGSFTRNLNEKVYVKELILVNYSKMKILPEGFGLKEVTYADNGKGYDLVKGDGIYTSVDRFEITPKQAGNTIGVSVPVSDQIVVDHSFKHHEDLNNGLNRLKIKVTCDFYKCGCPCKTFTCNACIWWGWSCWAMGNCSVTVEY
jgi:hypothetical protein